MSDSDAAAVARALISRWEGFRSRPYLCPAGVPTIGYGFTHYADGTRVTLTDPPMERAAGDALLDHLLRTKYLRAAAVLCPTLSDPGHLGAITDFCFNLGAGALRASTLRQKILHQDWSAVPGQLRRWVRAQGRILPGLVARREAEAAYFPPTETL
ncbi:MAG: lysozyme [Rhizorhabdus sp.]|uniref:lysozyme n=1 Tax=Rhizorhabdus sp. TaxID=1968843 RepID=UPI001B4DD522|nr:lysozyme [Rhizorhabdus sp.]MBP8231775.1 lysozyme [Rhizorhabdus sp.]